MLIMLHHRVTNTLEEKSAFYPLLHTRSYKRRQLPIVAGNDMERLCQPSHTESTGTLYSLFPAIDGCGIIGIETHNPSLLTI